MRFQTIVDSVITEMRTSPQLNHRYLPGDVIQMHSQDPSVFVHFSQTPKLGINPNTKYSKSTKITPAALYSYPVSYIAKSLQAGKRVLHHAAPFFTDYEYVTIFKEMGDVLDLRDSSRIENMILDFGEWAIEYFERQQVPGSDPYRNRSEANERFYNWISKREQHFGDSRASQFWEMTHFFVKDFGNESISLWTKILRELGLVCIIDHEGIIHRAEPIQAIHLYPSSSIEVVEQMDNRLFDPRG